MLDRMVRIGGKHVALFVLLVVASMFGSALWYGLAEMVFGVPK